MWTAFLPFLKWQIGQTAYTDPFLFYIQPQGNKTAWWQILSGDHFSYCLKLHLWMPDPEKEIKIQIKRTNFCSNVPMQGCSWCLHLSGDCVMRFVKPLFSKLATYNWTRRHCRAKSNKQYYGKSYNNKDLEQDKAQSNQPKLQNTSNMIIVRIRKNLFRIPWRRHAS